MSFVRGFCAFLSGVLGLYSTIILIRIVVSWILLFNSRNGWRSGYGGYGFRVEDPQNPTGIAKVDAILGKICDPYLNLFRNFKSLRKSTIDFTPILAFLVISLVRTILSLFANYYKITIWIVLAIIIDGLWSAIFSFLLILTLILLIIRFFVGRSSNPSKNNYIYMLDTMLNAPVEKVYKLFFRKKNVDDQKLVIVSIIFYAIVFLVLKIAVNALVNLLIQL